MAARQLAEAEDGGEVDLDDVRPVLFRELGGGRAPDDSRIIDENVDGAKFLHRELDQLHAGFRVGDVGHGFDGPGARRAHGFANLGDALGIDAVHDDVGACLREANRHARPQTGLRSGHQSVLTFETE